MDTIYEKWSAIGNAIRNQTGGTELLSLDEMASEIENISRSGGLLTVVAEPGAAVTVTNGSLSYTKTAGSSGEVVFEGLANGIWTISGTNGDMVSSESVTINIDYSKQLRFVTYLYHNGTMYNPMSSGMSDYRMLYENTDNKLVLSAEQPGMGGTFCYLLTEEKIDLTGYNWLYIDVYSTGFDFYVGFGNYEGEYQQNVLDIAAHIKSAGLYKVSLSGFNSGSYKFGFGNYIESYENVLISSVFLCHDDVYDATELDQTYYMMVG